MRQPWGLRSFWSLISLRLVAIFVSAAVLLAFAFTWAADLNAPTHQTEDRPPGLHSGFGLLRRDGYIRRVAGLVVVASPVAGLAQESIPGVLQGVGTPARGQGVQWIPLVVQLLALPLLLPGLEVRRALLVAPAFALVSMLLLVTWPVFKEIWPAGIADTISVSWGYVAVLSLFLSAARNAKYDGLIMIGLWGAYAGGACGRLISGLLLLFGASHIWLMIMPLIPIAFWVWIALGIEGTYHSRGDV